MIYHPNTTQEKAGISLFQRKQISEKVKNKEHYIMIKGSISRE